jgi:hypothetical protein
MSHSGGQMGLLDTITTGKQSKAMIHTIYGLPGVGKTTWASKFPKCLILDLEKGSSHLEVARLDSIDTFHLFKNILNDLLTSSHLYQTIAVDSIEALESLIADQVCQEGAVETIEKYDGGYGKGYIRTRELMREVMTSLRALNEKKNITVILIGHSQVKTHNDPAENAAYDRYVMRVNDKMGAVIRDLSDNVFFACHKVSTFNDKGKIRAISDGERVIKTEWRASADAKNRLNLPFEIPLSYEAFSLAIESTKPKSVESLREEINEMVRGLDQETKPKAVEAVKKAQTVEELLAIKNRISVLINA